MRVDWLVKLRISCATYLRATREKMASGLSPWQVKKWSKLIVCGVYYLGKYPPLATSTSVNSCEILYMTKLTKLLYIWSISEMLYCDKGVARGIPGCPYPALCRPFCKQITYNIQVTIWWVPSVQPSVTPPPPPALWKILASYSGDSLVSTFCMNQCDTPPPPPPTPTCDKL